MVVEGGVDGSVRTESDGESPVDRFHLFEFLPGGSASGGSGEKFEGDGLWTGERSAGVVGETTLVGHLGGQAEGRSSEKSKNVGF